MVLMGSLMMVLRLLVVSAGSLVVLLCLQDKTVILRTVTSVLMVVLKVV